MNLEELQTLIDQGEGQRLDFKRGVPSTKDLGEMVICFANAEGGRLLLGVNNEGDIVGCGSYDIPHLLSSIYRVTEPSLTVDIEEVDSLQGTVLVVSVPRTPFVHATSGGVYRRRVGRECLPMSPQDVIAQQAERVTLDYSTTPAGRARYPDDVDSQAMELLVSEVKRRQPSLSGYSDVELMRSLKLLIRQEEAVSDRLTVAGLLLLGRSESIQRELPQAEVTYLRQRTETDIVLTKHLCLPLPHLLTRLEELIGAASETHSFRYGLLRIDIPGFPSSVYREAVLNAVAHRNYALAGNVVIRQYPDRLEVTSPGGFPTGVSTDNILRQVVPRNRALADALFRLGYVEKAGIGVDMMYKEMLRLGKQPPEFITESKSVRLLLRDATFDEQFAAFAENRSRQGTPLSLDQLLVLSYLKRHLELARAQAVALLQRSEREVSERLTTMVRGGLLERRGTGGGAVYQMSASVAEELGLPPRERLIESIRCEQMVLRYVEEKGSIRNAECQQLCGLSPRQAGYLLSKLVEAGELEKRGRKRGTHYVLPTS